MTLSFSTQRKLFRYGCIFGYRANLHLRSAKRCSACGAKKRCAPISSNSANWSRIGYATSRVFVTCTDSGGTEFNYSELVGNSLAVGISNAYYPGSRTSGANFQKLALQFATDAVSNVLKEFWHDVKRNRCIRKSN